MRKSLSVSPCLSASFFCLCLWAAAGPAFADADDRTDHKARHHADQEEFDRIRSSVRAGKLLPLARIKQDVIRRWPGEIVDVSISHEHAAVSYEFRILSPKGRLVEIEADAASGAILEVENE